MPACQEVLLRRRDLLTLPINHTHSTPLLYSHTISLQTILLNVEQDCSRMIVRLIINETRQRWDNHANDGRKTGRQQNHPAAVLQVGDIVGRVGFFKSDRSDDRSGICQSIHWYRRRHGAGIYGAADHVL